MAIKDWPCEERPREKLLAKGAQALSDAELLAIFLRTGIKGKTAVDLARELLKEFKGLRYLLGASYKNFCTNPGLGTAKYALLQAVLEMGRRHLQETLRYGDAMLSSTETRRFLLSQLRHHPHEVFACLFLDNRHRIISFDEMFHGTINHASIYPREVVKRALHHNAAAIILAHNHPSGIAEPSEEDIQITTHLYQALQLVDIRVLDHMIVGDDQVTSLAELGLLHSGSMKTNIFA